MPENSFDIVSKIDVAEVNNAIQQALKEITTRFDLKGKVVHGPAQAPLRQLVVTNLNGGGVLVSTGERLR